MAYDNFENTPFDLNHDGHIDSNEAAYIYDTFYNEDNNVVDAGLKDDISFSGGGYYPTAEQRKKQKEDMDQLRRKVQESDRNNKLITFGIMIAIGIILPNKLAACLLIFIVYVIASMFDVFG